MVLNLDRAVGSELPRELSLKGRFSNSIPSENLGQLVWAEAREYAFLTSSPADSVADVLTSEHPWRSTIQDDDQGLL